MKSVTQLRPAQGLVWLEQFRGDLWFGIRLCRKHPGSFALAVAALTLGIGLATFSLGTLNCVFFGKLPVPEPDRVVYATVPPALFREINEQQKSFLSLSAFSTGSANFKAVHAPTRRPVCFIGANFLDVVQVAPLHGRAFLPGEGKPGAEPVVLIGYDLWQREFGASPAALGAVIRLDGQPRTVVGIMPAGFKFPIDDEIWVPAEPGTGLMSGWGFAFGRLKPSISFKAARAELEVLCASLERSSAAGTSQPPQARILVGRFTHFLIDFKGANGPGPAVLALVVITLLVLITACANVAGLNLANAGKRATELAVRSAIGATRRRLMGQMLSESLLLAVGGALGGLGLIALLSRWFENWFASQESQFSQIPFWMTLRIDGRLLAGLTGLILLASLLAGLWPALQATRRDTNELLNARAGGTPNSRAGRLQWCLVLVQVTFSLVVLTQSFLLLGFSRRLKETNLPFDPGKVLSARFTLPASLEAGAFFQALERDLAAVPGVQAAALTSSDPASGHVWQQLSLESVDYPRPEDHPWAASDVVSPGFFGALGLSLLEGRGFSQADQSGSLPVAVVNATFAKRFLKDNPLGRRFREGTNGWLTVVGCVPDLRYDPSAAQPEPLYYVPLPQRPQANMAILLRGASPASDWIKPLRAEVTRLAPDLALYHVAAIQTLMLHQVIGYYLASLLLGTCGAGSLFLATIGIFGLITFSVTQRTREIGIRLALGGTRRRIVLTVLKQALGPITTGLSAGALLGWGLQQVLNHSIAGYPEVRHPVLLFLAAIAFLGLISFAAVLLPASRGARVEPMVALRYE